MYMLKSVVSVAVFAAAAIAQSTNLAFTSFPPTTVAAGSPITLTWIGGDSTAVSFDVLLFLSALLIYTAGYHYPQEGCLN